MTELHVLVRGDVADRVVSVAQERGVTPDEVVDDVLDHNIPPRRRLRFIGIGHSGQHDNAERSEEILREHFAK